MTSTGNRVAARTSRYAPMLGVSPPRSSAAQSSIRSAPPRSAATASSTDSAATSISTRLGVGTGSPPPAGHLAGHPLGVAEDPHDVLAEYLADVRLLVPAVEQFLGDVRVVRDVIHLRGQPGDAVEVRADPDVVDAGGLDDVFD